MTDYTPVADNSGSKISPSPLGSPEQGISRYDTGFENKLYAIKDEEAIFIPTYIALVAKNFNSLDLKEGILTFLGTLIIRINIAGVPQPVIDDIKSGLSMRMGEKPLTLNSEEEGVTMKMEGNLLVFTYRFETEVEFLANVRKLPFDSFKIGLVMELTSKYVEVTEAGKESTIKYRFNLHLNKEKQETLSFKKGCDRLAEYEIAYPLCEINLVEELKKYGKNEKYVYYPKVEFLFLFVREPWHMLLTVIFPIIVLDLISLAIFATENSLADRIGNIATIMLALIAYLPTVRSEVPYVAYFTLCDWLIYSCIFINLLCLLEAFIINYHDTQVITTVIAAISCAFLVILSIYLFVRCVKHLRFKKKWTQATLVEVKKSSSKFDVKNWENPFLRTLNEPKAELM